MKRIMMTMMTAIMIAVSANAMSYNEARHEASIITNQMARELNLSSRQYNAVYEVNFNYLYNHSSRAELARILTPAQYRAFKASRHYHHHPIVTPARPAPRPIPAHHHHSVHNWHSHKLK